VGLRTGLGYEGDFEEEDGGDVDIDKSPDEFPSNGSFCEPTKGERPQVREYNSVEDTIRHEICLQHTMVGGNVQELNACDKTAAKQAF
jgi:hypothetical protein